MVGTFGVCQERSLPLPWLIDSSSCTIGPCYKCIAKTILFRITICPISVSGNGIIYSPVKPARLVAPIGQKLVITRDTIVIMIGIAPDFSLKAIASSGEGCNSIVNAKLSCIVLKAPREHTKRILSEPHAVYLTVYKSLGGVIECHPISGLINSAIICDNQGFTIER